MSNSFDHDQIQRFITPDLGQNYLSAADTNYMEQPSLWYCINRCYVNQPINQQLVFKHGDLTSRQSTVCSWMEEGCIFQNKMHLRNIIEREDE